MADFYAKLNDLETNNYGKFTAWFGVKSLKELLQRDNIETLLERRHFSPKGNILRKVVYERIQL